jgi:hypothetical protein
MSYIFYFMLIGVLIYWVERPYGLVPKGLIIRPDPAAQLEEWLKRFQWGNRPDLGSQANLPRYKYYSDIVEVLLQMARRMGGQYQDSLLFLREGLQRDQQFERRLRETSTGIYLQLLLMMGLTWAFVVVALQLVEVTVPMLNLGLILGWQLTGLGVLPVTLNWLRRRYFGDIGVLWKMLFILKSLSRLPIARSDILALAEIEKLNQIRSLKLAVIADKLRDTCQKTLKQGLSYDDDVKYLMEELRFLESWHFELFSKRLMVIKLGLLGVFFLPSYLAFIFCLLSDLMALM